MRKVFLIGIIVGLLYMVLCVGMCYYTHKMRDLYHELGKDYFDVKPHVHLTRMAGAANIFFIAYFFIQYLLSLIRVRGRLPLTLGIFGMLFTVGVCIGDLCMVEKAQHSTFDEVGLYFAFSGFVQMGYCLALFMLVPKKVKAHPFDFDTTII
ncbi:MAG: hypothetical protein IAF38_00300 [Bacteroidia bacterium]|nr:hypothetical protein [Bacteroidia bacterium]